MAQRLIIEIIGDSRSIERSLKQTERNARSFSSRMSRTLGRAGIAAGAALGTGIAVGLKRSVDAAMEAQKVLGQTQVAVKNVGASWERFGAQIQTSTTSLSRLAAVNDEELLQSFSTLVRSTKDVNEALRLNALVADIARARNMDLQSAATLVAKVNIGQLGALRRVGIQIDSNATSTEALAELQRRYAGAAEEYGRSAAGAQDRFRIAVEELEEKIGEALLPTISDYLGKATDWLENTKNQEKVTGTLTSSVENLAAAFETVAAGIDHAKDSWDKWRDATGAGGDKKNFLQTLVGGTLPEQLRAAYGNMRHLQELIDQAIFGKPKGKPGAGGSPFGWFAQQFGAVGAAAGGAVPHGMVGGARAGQFLPADAFSAPILSFLAKSAEAYKKLEAAEKARKRFWAERRRAQQQAEALKERRLGWLDFGIERAGATRTLADDRRALRAKEKFLQELIASEGRTLERTRELWRTRQQIRDLNKNQAKQGDPLAGLMQVSSKQLAGVLAAGTGLSAAGMGRLQQNISGQEIQMYTSLTLDGETVGRAVTRHQARTSHRTARQTSGFRG